MPCYIALASCINKREWLSKLLFFFSIPFIYRTTNSQITVTAYQALAILRFRYCINISMFEVSNWFISFSHYKDTINNVTTKVFHHFYS